MSDTVSLLAIVASMETGGIELYLINVLRSIDRERIRATIVCTGRPGNWYRDELEELGVRTVFCPNPYSQVGFVRRIGRLMQDVGAEVVCDFRGDFAAPTMWAAKRRGIASRVAMYRSTDPLFRPSIARNAYARLLHGGTRRWATRIVGNSRAVLDGFFPGWESGDQFAVVHNGVDVTRFAPGRDGSDVRREFGIAPHALVVGHVGRLHAAKNHAVLLGAFARARRDVAQAHLLLVGDGGLRSEIEAQIAEAGLGAHVTLAGRRTDVPRMLSAMDVYLFPSIFEGHPNALLEAMACGLPAVASDIPPVVETLPPDSDEDLFRPDDTEGMARRLVQYCGSAELRARRGSRLRRHVVENFGIEEAAARLLDCWMEPAVPAAEAPSRREEVRTWT